MLPRQPWRTKAELVRRELAKKASFSFEKKNCRRNSYTWLLFSWKVSLFSIALEQQKSKGASSDETLLSDWRSFWGDCVSTQCRTYQLASKSAPTNTGKDSASICTGGALVEDSPKKSEPLSLLFWKQFFLQRTVKGKNGTVFWWAPHPCIQYPRHKEIRRKPYTLYTISGLSWQRQSQLKARG